MKKLFSIGAACLLFVACGSSFTVEDVAGTYHLTSVDGSDLPAPFFDGTITSGTLTLGTDSTVRNVVSFTHEGYTVFFPDDTTSGRYFEGGATDEEIMSGMFTLTAPDTIVLIDQDPTFALLKAGGIIEIAGWEEASDMVFVYTKQ